MSDPTPTPIASLVGLSIPPRLIGAMLEIQKKLGTDPLFKNRKADAGKKQYGYVDLPTVLDHILATCREHDVLVTQAPAMERSDELAIVTVLAHRSGDQLAAVMRFPRSGDPQALGSAVTYLRRYSLLSLFALAPEDDDDDGQAARRSPLPAAPPAPDRSVPTLPEAMREASARVWPDVTLDGPTLARFAEAVIGKDPKGLSAEEKKTWILRALDPSNDDRIRQRTEAVVSFLRPAAPAAPAPDPARSTAAVDSTPAYTNADFEDLLKARIDELDPKARPSWGENPVVHVERLTLICRALFGQDSGDWNAWNPEKLKANTDKLRRAPADKLKAKIDHLLLPF